MGWGVGVGSSWSATVLGPESVSTDDLCLVFHTWTWVQLLQDLLRLMEVVANFWFQKKNRTEFSIIIKQKKRITKTLAGSPGFLTITGLLHPKVCIGSPKRWVKALIYQMNPRSWFPESLSVAQELHHHQHFPLSHRGLKITFYETGD